MRKLLFMVAVAASTALLFGCAAGGPVQHSEPSTAPSVAAPSAAGGSETYRLVVSDLAESQAYEEFTSAVNEYLEDNPSSRCESGDFESLRRDADNLRELAEKLPRYDGDDATATLAYQHAERYAQAVVSSADAFATAKTVADVEAATTLFGAGYDEMKELSSIVAELRRESE